jgi:hypothetical protein
MLFCIRIQGEYQMLAQGTKVKQNEIINLPDGTTKIVAIHKGEPMEILIDTADLPLVEPYYWYVEKSKYTYYASTMTNAGGSSRPKRMHAMLFPSAVHVDHKDGDGLNNRRSNLRPATFSQNNANRRKISGTTSPFIGVSWDKKRERWFAKVKWQQKQYALGRFLYADEAATVRDIKMLALAGEFAKLNFKINKTFSDAYIETKSWWDTQQP